MNGSLAPLALIVVVLGAAGVNQLRKKKPAATDPAGLSAELRLRLAAPDLTEVQFTQIVAEALAAAMGTSDVRVVGPLELTLGPVGHESRHFLTNAWNLCKAAPNEREHAVFDLVQGAVESRRLVDELPSRGQIVPMIKDARFIEGVNRTFGGDPQVAEPLAGDLWIVYALDRPKSLSFLKESERTKVGVDVSELRALAVANLRRVLPPVLRQGDGPAFMLTAGGNFEASLLLLDEVWDAQAKLVDGDLVAAVPSRDVLLFTGSRSTEGIQLVLQSIDRVSAAEAYPVSKSLLVRRDGRWQPFTPPQQ